MTIPPSKIIHKTTKNNANAVQSLKRLSHSNNNVSLLGAQTALKIDKTATGSVAEIKIQKSKQTKNGISNHTNGNKKYIHHQIKSADKINQNTAITQIAFQFFKSCRKFILYAASKIKIGKNTKNKISGVNSK